MKHLHQEFTIRFIRIALVVMCVVTFVGIASAQENTGKVQQGLVGGAVVSPERQEEYGLLTLSSGCSASLLRNNWAVTAAHCVDSPDPKNKGQFIQISEDSVTLTANWKNVQERQSTRIITFRPADVAIIRVAMPFSVRESTTNYNRDVFRDGQFPYFGTPVGVPIMIFGRGIYQFAQGSGASATPSQQDGQYRVGFVKTTRQDNDSVMRYWYPNTAGQMIAGGDSGGPAFAEVLNRGQVLVGVHSLCHSKCLPGQTCPPNSWMWVASTAECADAPIAPVWDEINRYLGAFVSEPLPREPGFIGTFGKTPPNYQPMWVYAIKNDGDMLWYRKDTGESPWQGPKKVGNGWNFKDVIPAGGNSIYALTDDGKLLWYRHDGFNDGSRNWPQPVEVGHGWNFTKIFSGGEGIVYALQADGSLLWYRHGGYADGGGPNTWIGPKAVGSGWQDFKEIFSMGQGKVYAVKPDGTLVFYQQIGWQTGERSWEAARQVGTGWADFRQIVAVGDGVILAIKNDGKLLWYKDLGLERAAASSPHTRTQFREKWEGPVEIGSGWQGFKKIIALLPVATAPIVR